MRFWCMLMPRIPHHNLSLVTGRLPAILSLPSSAAGARVNAAKLIPITKVVTCSVCTEDVKIIGMVRLSAGRADMNVWKFLPFGVLLATLAAAGENLGEQNRHDEILKRIDLENSILEHEFNLGRSNTPRDAVRCIAAEGIRPRYPSFEDARSRCISKSEFAAKELEAKERKEKDTRTSIIQVWADSYVRCAISSAGLVDDGISDAQTIAIGLHAKCRNSSPALESVMSIDRAEELAITLRPKLVQIVLSRRTAMRARSN